MHAKIKLIGYLELPCYNHALNYIMCLKLRIIDHSGSMVTTI